MNLATLYTQYQKALTNVARRITKNRADAEDVVQTAFVQALQADFRGDCAPFTWLFKIVRNRAIDLVRARRDHQAKEALYPALYPIPGPSEPSLEVERAELRMALGRAISKLPEIYRIPFVLHMIQNWPCKLVAQSLQLQERTVVMRLFRARAMLRILLKDCDPRPYKIA